MQKSLLLSKDIVAIDAAGAKMAGRDPFEIWHIKNGHEMKLGNMNLNELNIKKINISG